MLNQPQYCLYYQGALVREKIWFAVGVLRNDDHICFERALDKQAGTFEFFVPPLQQAAFERIMNELVIVGVVLWFREQENPFNLNQD